MNPFLQLDALRSQRDADFRQRHEARLKQFGDLPLSLNDLYNEYKDREQKSAQLAHQKQMDEGQLSVSKQNADRQSEWMKASTRNLDEDNRRAGETEQRAKTEQELRHANDLKENQRQQGKLEALPATQLPDTAVNPNRKEISGDQYQALTAEQIQQNQPSAKEQENKRQEDFLRQVRQNNTLPNLSDDEVRGLYQQAALQRGDIEWKQGQEEKKLADHSQQWRQTLQMKARNALAAAKAKEAKASQPERKMLAQFQTSINADAKALHKVDVIEAELNSGKPVTGTGPFGEIYKKLNTFIGNPDVDQAKYTAELAGLVNQRISEFGGKAVTEQEMARVVQEMPKLGDSLAASKMLIGVIRNAYESNIEQTLGTASWMPGGSGWADVSAQDIVYGHGPKRPTAPAAPSAVPLPEREAKVDTMFKILMEQK